MSRHHSNRRDILARVAIGAGICFGLASVVVAPLHNEKVEAEAAIRAASMTEHAARQPSQPLAPLRKNADLFSAAILERSSTVYDELSLYEAYARIAEQAGVQIDRFDPRPIPLGRSSSNSRESRSLTPTFSASVRIDALGDLGSTVRFLGRLQSDSGFAVVRSARVTPSGDSASPQLRLIVETEHFSFTIPESSANADQMKSAEGS